MTSVSHTRDLLVIGGGPGGSAAAIRAARAGAKVTLFEKGAPGRDKICGDGLTPRAIRALLELDIDLTGIHRTRGLRMKAFGNARELDWPGGAFPDWGAVWPRRRLDTHLVEVAEEAGAEVLWSHAATPIMDGNRVVGVEANGGRWHAPMTIVATGAPNAVTKGLGADRNPDEPFGLAIRTYAATPRDTDAFLEADLTLRDDNGAPIPGYGWMFPVGDGTVNIGVGALSTMKGFKKLNLNKLQDIYRASVAEEWELGPDLERPRAWRLPMSVTKTHGPGWVVVGDAAGLVNPMNGEGIDYGLESGILAADLALDDPLYTPARYAREVRARYEPFMDMGRRFSFLVGHPWILRTGLRFAVSTDAISKITLEVMANLVEADSPGASGWTYRTAGRLFDVADPLLRATRAER
ncbi:MAG: NAD(P)/FAD-dependent oxidoreductase [Microthrixaceae bacterium]|nr:NAD(P)/FAD-dependent oxidoreductase [Microthrixaceae bacterium]